MSASHTGEYWKEMWEFPPQEMLLLYKGKYHLHTECKARFMWGFLVWGDLLSVFLISLNLWGNRQTQSCSFWAPHLLALASRMSSSHVAASPMPGVFFSTLLWAARAEFCHCTEVRGKLIFSVRLSQIIAQAVKALWWYLLEMIVSMTINSRAINWCY